MLTSSRALIHIPVPWRPVAGRIAHGNIVQRQQTQNFGAIAARPYPVAVLDFSDERALPNTTRMSLFRSYATSVHSLQMLVQESRFEEAGVMLLELQKQGAKVQTHLVYEKAVGNLLSQAVFGVQDREILMHWLELLPDVHYSPPNALHGLLNDLRRHMKSDTPISMSVARVLARKGYKTLVTKEILPLIRDTLDGNSFVLFEQELAKVLADFTSRASTPTLTIPSQSEVFEDPSEDYVSVMATSTPPPPSVLEIIEKTLPPILPTPDASNHGVFEDEMDADYTTHYPSVHITPRRFPADQLSRLVGERQYDEAFYLLTELNHLRVEVPPCPTYSAAALEALKRPISDHYTLEDQLNRFITWFSLVPPVHEAHDKGSIGAIQQLVLQTTLTNMELVVQFTTILAQKGYGGVQTQALPIIMRFASSDAVRKYIQELEDADLAYWTMYKPEEAVVRSNEFSVKLRSAAVRLLAYSGRVEDAIVLIPDSRSPVRLTAYTYDKLLRTIRDSKNPSHAEHMPRIKALHEHAASTAEKINRVFNREEEQTMAAELHTDGADVRTGSLSETLRYLKRALKSPDKNPHPFIIVDFLDHYLATGRSRAPILLLNIALNSSYHSTSIFIFAEMLYYRRLGHHRLVIQTFVDHFYLSGVPRDDILRLHHESHNRQGSDTGYTTEASENQYRFARICKFSPSLLPRGKAWPMKIHCNLVWHALVALTPTHDELQHLYTKLINLARGQDELRTRPHHASIQPLLPPPSWRQPVGCAAFTPFMRGLMRVSGPERGIQIIGDMLSLDIEPGVYHFTELAGRFARNGEMSRALMILDQLEASSKLRKRLQQQRQDRREGVIPSRSASSASTTTSIPSAPSLPAPLAPSSSLTSSTGPHLNSDSDSEQAPSVPEPDLVIYISLMRGFLIAKSIDGFEEVHKRLLAIRRLLPRKRFKKDQEALLHEVYADFRRLSRRHRYNWQKERKVGFQTALEATRRSKERVQGV